MMAGDKPHLNFKWAVICDDIRREDNGKQILIGVYSENIGIPSFPANIALSIWLQCIGSKAGEVPFDFRLLFDGREISGGSGSINVPFPNKMLSVGIGGLFAQILSPGTLTFQIRQHGGRWQKIKQIHVAQQGSATN